MLHTVGGRGIVIPDKGKFFVVVEEDRRRHMIAGITHNVAGFEDGQKILETWHRGDSSMLIDCAAWQSRSFARIDPTTRGERGSPRPKASRT